ncbi:MAG TPA: RecX family transcriptional regulator [Chloroflexota bacterium]|nr:RecX family transcriptional regulator [Chloroflexota bacterium]
MRRITSIEPQSRPGSRRINLYLDGQYAFSLDEEVAAALSVDTMISDAEIADLQRRDRLHQVYDAALTLLTYRPRSASELRSRLLRRSFDPELVDEALQRLKTQKVVDDELFAQFWVENRMSYSPRGGRLLKAELRAKGIEREIIEGALPEAEEEEQAAYKVAERKARSLSGLEWQEFRHKLGDHLVRRGFDYDTTSSIVRRIWEEIHQQVPDEE